MNDILMEIFPEAVSNLIIRFNIHPVAEAFKRRIKIDEEEIQAGNKFSKMFIFFCIFSESRNRKKTRI